MNSLAIVEREVAALEVVVTEDELTVSLIDGRRISVPLAWYPRLSHASKAEREKYELIGRGTGIHWPLREPFLRVRKILIILAKKTGVHHIDSSDGSALKNTCP